MNYEQAINENLEYCNQLAQRINTLADCMQKLADSVLQLQGQVKTLLEIATGD